MDTYKSTVIRDKWLFVLSFAIFLLFIAYRIYLVFYPQPNVGGVENNVIYFVQRILDGQTFYTDPEKIPFSIAQYSPFYYVIVSWIAKLFNTGPDDLLKLYDINRCVALALNFLFIAIVYRICRKIFQSEKRKSVVAAIAAFCFLEITSFGRPDSLYHFFFMLSLYFFLLWDKNHGQGSFGSKEKPGKRILIVLEIAISSSLALFSKQTAIVLPVIFCCWMFFRRQYRPLFTYGFTYLLITIILVWLFQNGTGGLQSLQKNVIGGISNSIGFGWYWNVIVKDYYLKLGWALVALAFCLLLITKRQTGSLSTAPMYVFISLFILLNGIALKFGSNPGYLTEWWTLLFMLIAAYWKFIVSWRPMKLVFVSGICLAILLKLFLVYKDLKVVVADRPYSVARNTFEQQKRLTDYLKQKMSSDSTNRTFTNYYTPDYFVSNFLFREAVMPQMDIVGLASYPMKQYDYSEFEEALDSGKIKWMLMRIEGPQKLFFRKKLDYYQLDTTIAGFNVYHFQQ